MANKTFRRVLSIIMCAAMLVSVFAVSFSASAADDSSVVYDWDFTDTANGETYVSAMIAATSEFVNTGKAANFTYNADGYCRIGGGQWYYGAVFSTPDGYTPSKLTVVSHNTLRETGQLQYASAGAVIGKTTYGTGDEATTRTVQVSVMSKTYGVMLHINDNNWSLDKTGVVNTDVSLNLKNIETGDYVGNSYQEAFGFKIANANHEYLDYKYDVSVSENNDVVVVPTITYTDPDTSLVYETEAEPITINLASLQAANSTVVGFTPSFGVARFCEFMQDTNPAKLYSVKAEYTKACNHEHTRTVAGRAATCTEAGVADSVFCDDCQKTISGGEVLKALGHYSTSEGVVTDPVCNKDGYTTYVCDRCHEEYTIPGEKATGTHDKSRVVETVEATCTTDGYTVYECDNCGEQFKDDTVKASGHGDYKLEIVKDPTRDEEGKKWTICGKCGIHPTNWAEVVMDKVVLSVSEANVILDGTINLKLTVAANEYIDQSSLKLTITDQVSGVAKDYTVANGLVSNGGGTYSVIISKYAHQMTDKLDIKLVGKTIGLKETYEYDDEKTDYSIAKNLGSVFASANDVTKTLIAKLANYGTAAQKYDEAANGIAYDEYANDFLTAEEKETYKTNDVAFEEMADCTREGSFAVEGSKYFADVKGGLTLALQSKVSMVVKVAGVKLDEGQKLYVGTSTADAVEFTEDGDYLTANIGSFAPNQYKDTVKLRLFVKDVNGEFLGTSSNEVTYSVGAYIYKMCGATSSNEFADLLNAMSEYYTAAVDYDSQMS